MFNVIACFHLSRYITGPGKIRFKGMHTLLSRPLRNIYVKRTLLYVQGQEKLYPLLKKLIPGTSINENHLRQKSIRGIYHRSSRLQMLFKIGVLKFHRKTPVLESQLFKYLYDDNFGV